MSRWKFDLEVRSLIARRFEKRSQYSHKKPLQYSLEQRLQHSLDKRPLEKGNPPKSPLENPNREEPSIIAASSSSVGIDFKNGTIIIMA